jgi:hypothetical protein
MTVDSIAVTEKQVEERLDRNECTLNEYMYICCGQ